MSTKYGRVIREATEERRLPLYGLALIRIMVGYHYVVVGVPKLTEAFFSGGPLLQQLSGVAADPIPIHRTFITQVVMPNPSFFAPLVAYGEVLIGLSLLTGTLVRLASCFGAFHSLNIYLAIGYPNGGAQLSLNRLYIVLHLVFVVAAAGRSLGVDGWLHRRFHSTRLF